MGTNISMEQNRMTPELLWGLGRVSPELLTSAGQLLYSVTHFDIEENEGRTQLFSLDVKEQRRKQLSAVAKERSDFQEMSGGKIGYTRSGQLWEMTPNGRPDRQVTHETEGMQHIKVSSKGNYILFAKKVKLKKVQGKDLYPDLSKSEVQVYSELMYRHWDRWSDGSFTHIFYAPFDQETGTVGAAVDVMKDEPYDCPLPPFGGGGDFMWQPGEDKIWYLAKKKSGTENALSTDSCLYEYDVATGKTTLQSSERTGYDTQPAFDTAGQRLAWTSMARDGYESDKNDIIVRDLSTGEEMNLTAEWDGTVEHFKWAHDGAKIFFTAAVDGTIQLFSVAVPASIHNQRSIAVQQWTSGDYNITDIVGQAGTTIVVARQDMNHATELFTFRLQDRKMTALTHVNDEIYQTVAMGEVERQWVSTTDGKRELVWVIYPPDFDPDKKYPALLYCQGGPQSEVSQFYSFRWNFQLMAAHDYIIVAPNRRGLPGFGIQWNEAISKDWGGQPMKDYLSAIDAIAEQPFVDENRLGCVGASYGGYSVYMLAGIHQNRFKTFIAHDGLFDLKSWYGTTEELFFARWEIGGSYWEVHNSKAQKSYREFNPSDYVKNWNTPILVIQGGIDFRVPVGQGLQAFQAAQLKGIKSKILYFPEENHWVLRPQNALVWQREFYRWLDETL